jgi:chaperonin cofactor prefoldin
MNLERKIDEIETKMMDLQQEASELRAELTRRIGEEIDCV